MKPISMALRYREKSIGTLAAAAALQNTSRSELHHPSVINSLIAPQTAAFSGQNDGSHTQPLAAVSRDSE